MPRLLVFLLVVASAGGTPAVKVKAIPQVLMRGGTLVAIECKVRRDPANRVLEYGIVGYAEGSQRQLEGEQSPITWRSQPYPHIPCGAGPVYCAVQRNDGSWVRDTQELLVADCDAH